MKRRVSLGRTLLAWLVLPAATTTMGLLALVFAILGSRAIPEACSRLWARLLLAAMGVRVQATFDPALDTGRTYVMVANHQSHLDVPCLIATWPGPLRFVAKRSLFAIPIFGQALAAMGHVPVVRGHSEQARAALSRAVGPLRTWVSVLFFAEGTRSRDGRLQPFKKGCLAMAEAASVPVVPVGLSGTFEILPRVSGWLSPGEVRVHFGAPLEGMERSDTPRAARIAVVREGVVDALARARPPS